jgi:hypothetical protein
MYLLFMVSLNKYVKRQEEATSKHLKRDLYLNTGEDMFHDESNV